MVAQKKLYTNLNKSAIRYFTIHSIVKTKQKIKQHYLDYFSVYTHKKLSYFQFAFNLKFYNFSTGQILRKRIKKLKFFKKSIKNIGITINLLNRKMYKRMKSIYLLFCKNFNLKHFLILKKIFITIKPAVRYSVLTLSWNPIIKKKRRIKKKIFRNIFKNSTKV